VWPAPLPRFRSRRQIKDYKNIYLLKIIHLSIDVELHRLLSQLLAQVVFEVTTLLRVEAKKNSAERIANAMQFFREVYTLDSQSMFLVLLGGGLQL